MPPNRVDGDPSLSRTRLHPLVVSSQTLSEIGSCRTRGCALSSAAVRQCTRADHSLMRVNGERSVIDNTPTHPVFLVRHGETESNLLCRYAGRSPESLTSRGRSQAERIAEELLRIEPTAIYSSRIARGAETAAIIAERHQMSWRLDERLDELLMGPWEGMFESEVAARYPQEWAQWCTKPDELFLTGRETLIEVRDRIMSIVSECAQVGPTILVTHVAPIRVAVLTTLGLCLREYRRLRVPNASCVRLALASGAATRFPSGQCVRSELYPQSDELAIA